ncbi:MAG: putative lipid II flippase FtsW [Candidatus Omnitrophica bacterium]|nr:putative lipid II flippase FtsW [Candidatus Omnitrophota bacterium]
MWEQYYTDEKEPQIDLNSKRRFIFFTIFFLTLFGMLFVYEASSIYAYSIKGDPSYFLKRQFIFFIIGLFLFFFTLFLDLNFLRKYYKEFLLFTLFLLLLVLLFGRRIGGAKRWFNFGEFNFQPSEILKISFLIYCVEYCNRKKTLLRTFKLGLLPLGIVLGILCLLLILQPDLGTALFWVIWTFLFLFLYRARKSHLFVVGFITIIFIIFLVLFFPYRFRRIIAYVNPFADPQSSGFQIIQSQIAFCEGGLFGVGLGESKQKLFFLPAAHTDFIFSLIAEELGLVGALFFIFVFFILFNAMVKIAKYVWGEFSKGVLLGIIIIFFLEIVINIGVSCGFFPTKGMPLPFISYGGSNLVIHYILLGLFFNASKNLM